MRILKTISQHSAKTVRSLLDSFFSILQLLALITSLLACAQLNTQPPDTPVFTISRGGLGDAGVYPNYKIEIYKDGLVRYNGTLYVKVLGGQQTKITPEQVKELIYQYRKMYVLLKSMERRTGLNLSRLYGGYKLKLQDSSETFELGSPKEAHDMHESLNKMTPIKDWICFPDNEPLGQHYGCPIR